MISASDTIVSVSAHLSNFHKSFSRSARILDYLTYAGGRHSKAKLVRKFAWEPFDRLDSNAVASIDDFMWRAHMAGLECCAFRGCKYGMHRERAESQMVYWQLEARSS